MEVVLTIANKQPPKKLNHVILCSFQGVETFRLFLLIFGKMGASAAFATCYVYTSELFPTPVRNTAVGFW